MSSRQKTGRPVPFGLRSKILISLGLAFIAVIGLTQLVFVYGIPYTSLRGALQHERSAAIDTLVTFADLKKDILHQWIDDRRGDARAFAESDVFRELVYDLSSRIRNLNSAGAALGIKMQVRRDKAFTAFSRQLDLLKESYGLYDKIQIADAATGRILSSSDPEEMGDDISHDPQYVKVLKPGRDEFIDMWMEPGSDKLFYYIARAIYTRPAGRGAEAFAVLIMYCRADSIILPMLRTAEGLGKSGEVVLVDQDARILTELKHSLPDGRQATVLEYRIQGKPARLAAQGVEGVVESDDYRGVPVLAATRHMRITSDLGWGMVVKIDKSEVDKRVKDAALLNLKLSLAGVLVMLAMTYLIVTGLTRPLRALTDSVRRVEEGNLAERAPVQGSDEAGLLASAFNAMIERIQNWHRDLDEQVRVRTTQLHALNEELRKEKETAQKYLDIAGVMLLVLGVDEKVILINKRGARILGYSEQEIIGRNWFDHFIPQHELKRTRDIFDKLVSGKQDLGGYFENAVRTASGEERLIAWHNAYFSDSDGRIIGIISSGEDITDTRRLEDQLRQSQKMEGIGQLAGGIAHDFNNILSAIIGYGHITLMKMETDDPRRLNIEHMLEAADRAAHLTKDLLLFSRKHISDRKPGDVNDIVRNVEKFLVRIIGEDVACKTIYHERPIPVLADAHQLEQVLMNLATNARDAMPQGGTFSISIEEVRLDDGFMTAHGYGRPGAYALITVADSGKGMDEETQRRIFEPFFTTKEVGKGTGLGLAVVYGIIKQHEGYINVYSEPGKGTTFRIYLPAISSGTIEERTAAAAEHPLGGTETILLAEDDETLRVMTISVLEAFGYTIIAAVDGEDAVRLFLENKGRIHLLLFDLIMPRKTGKDAYDAIREIQPDIKILFSSGYAPDTIRQRALIGQDVPIAYKPISPSDLLRKVRQVLDAGKI